MRPIRQGTAPRTAALLFALLLAALLPGCAGSDGTPDPAAAGGGGLSLTLRPLPGQTSLAPAAGTRVAVTDGDTLLAESALGDAPLRLRDLPAEAPVLHLQLCVKNADGSVDEALVRASRAASRADPVFPIQVSIALPPPVCPAPAPAAPPVGGSEKAAPAADPEVDPLAWRDDASREAPPAPARAPLAYGVEIALPRAAAGAPRARFRVFLDKDGDGNRSGGEPVIADRLVFANEIEPPLDYAGE